MLTARSLLALALGLGAGAGITAALVPQSSFAQAPPVAKGAKPTTMVHLSKYSADPHAAEMALDLVRTLQAAGGNVVLFLDLEGVRLVDTRMPHQSRVVGNGPTIGERYDQAVAAGAKVLVCPHCAKAAGMDGGALRTGARIPSDAETARAIQSAQQVVDY